MGATLSSGPMLSRVLGLIATLVVLAPGLAGHAFAQTRFPLVVETGSTALQQFGISGAAELEDERDFKATPHRCYTYGGDGNGIAISDALLSAHTSKGFTLESLCLALVSEIRFDPETGKRLPTYIVVNREALQQDLRGRDITRMSDRDLLDCCSETGIASEEQPLAVPACFKGGAPYSDCAWRWDADTGRKLTEAETRRFRELGRAIETGIARAMKGEMKACGGKAPASDDIDVRWPCKAPRGRSETGYLQPDAKFVVDVVRRHVDAALVPAALARGARATFLDISPAFPRGFGYALMAEENGGPTPLKSALLRHVEAESRPSRSRIDANALRRHSGGS